MSSLDLVQRRRLLRNAGLNLVGQAIPLLVGLVTIPLIIRRLGMERFGVLSLAWVVIIYLLVFDLGLGRATARFVAERMARAEDSDASRLIWTATIAQTFVGAAAAVALAGLTPVAVDSVLDVPRWLEPEAKSAFSLVAISAPIMLISLTLRGALEAAQRFDLVNLVRTPLATGNFVLPLLGIVLGWGLPGIVGLMLFGNVVAAGSYYGLCARVFPGLRSGPRLDGGALRSLLAYGSWVTVSDVIGPVLVYMDRFVLGALVSVAAVSYYTAPFDAVARLWIIPTSLMATAFPAFTALLAQGHRRELEALVARSIRYVVVGLGAVIALLVVNAHDVLELWLGLDFAANSTTVLQVLAVGVLVNSVAQVLYALVQSSGRPDLTARLHVVELPVYLVLLWLMVSQWGVAGAAWAWLLRVTGDGLLLLGVARHLSLLPRREVVSVEASRALVLLAAFVVVAAMGAALVSAVWLRLVASALALCVLGLGWRQCAGAGTAVALAGFLRSGSK